MQKQISSKITALVFGVLVICFAIGFYVVAWQEPTEAPPEGNVPTPINIGTEPQAKAGRISATEFYDYNDPSYYINPSGQSTISELCFDDVCKEGWPVVVVDGNTCPDGYSAVMYHYTSKFCNGSGPEGLRSDCTVPSGWGTGSQRISYWVDENGWGHSKILSDRPACLYNVGGGSQHGDICYGNVDQVLCKLD